MSDMTAQLEQLADANQQLTEEVANRLSLFEDTIAHMHEGNNELASAFYQEMADIRAKLAAIQVNVQAQGRMIRRDEIEQVDMLTNLVTATQAQVFANSELINHALTINKIPQETYLDPGQVKKAARLADQQREKNDPAYRERMKYMRTVVYYSEVQMLDEQCPCGKHYGLRIVHEISKEEGIEIVEDNMCPLEYWKIQSLLANQEHKLVEFLHEKPLSKFLGWYEYND